MPMDGSLIPPAVSPSGLCAPPPHHLMATANVCPNGEDANVAFNGQDSGEPAEKINGSNTIGPHQRNCAVDADSSIGAVNGGINT